jgi:enoyl-CoA hydratase/carnithine racemase
MATEQTVRNPEGAASTPPGRAGDTAGATTDTAGPVGLELDGAVAVLTMRHAPHNFLGTELIAGLLAGLAWAREQRARAVVLRSGLRHFCAGADVGLFDSAERGAAPTLDVTEVLRAFEELPVPILASVHGVCVGGGFELALAADLVVAAESAKIGSVEATIGLNPLMGAIQRVAQRAGAARAKEMALLGRRYDAATLERWNVINRVVPDERLAGVTSTLAHELANGPTVAHASTKAIVAVAVNAGTRAADDSMAQLQRDIWESADLRTGLASLAANGPGAARFEGR